MSPTIEVPLDEVKRVFDLLEKVNSLFHQQKHSTDVMKPLGNDPAVPPGGN